jgi:putative spermidine/putrescine transport system permease protein
MTQAPERAPFLLGAMVVGVCAFVLAPTVLAVLASFSSGDQIAFPPPGWSFKWYTVAFENEAVLHSIALSAGIAAAVTAISTIAGTAAALAINHHNFRGRGIVKSILMLPLTLPAIVLGLAILFALPALGLKNGPVATAIGHCIIGVPYASYLVLSSLSNYDLTLERASATLGASRFQTFRWITWPLIKDGIVVSATFCFLLSFDNVAISLFLSRGDTLPLRLMQLIQSNADPSVAAISTALVVLSVILMVPLARAMRPDRLLW